MVSINKTVNNNDSFFLTKIGEENEIIGSLKKSRLLISPKEYLGYGGCPGCPTNSSEGKIDNKAVKITNTSYGNGSLIFYEFIVPPNSNWSESNRLDLFATKSELDLLLKVVSTFKFL